MKQQILPQKMKHKPQKVVIDQLQDQRKKKKNQEPTPNLPIETKNKFKIEMDSTPTFKKPVELKQKAQAPIGQAGRVNTNTDVISEKPGGTFKLPPAKFDAVPSPFFCLFEKYKFLNYLKVYFKKKPKEIIY